MPADLGPRTFAITTPDERARLAFFPARLTPGLVTGLDDYARDWLAGHGITSEPASWQPPAFLLDDLDLPGPDPSRQQPGQIHELITRQRLSVRAAARNLGTTIDVIRVILDEHPAPPLPLTPGQARSAGRTAAVLRARLSPQDLDDLYNGQKLSIRQLSHQLGTGRKVISGLLAEYGIPRRSGPARPPVAIDRNWLHQQYVLSRRTLPDIAAELGISTAYMTRRAKTLGIPLRGRGTPSHARSLRNPPAEQPDTSHQNGKQAR